MWLREFQLDSRGNLATFFGPLAPLAPGPSLGPMGPLNTLHQVRPQPHFYSLAFPTGNSHRHASNLQRPFDPLCALAPSGSSTSSLLSKQVLALALILARAINAPSASAAPSSGFAPPAAPVPTSATTSAVSSPDVPSPARRVGPKPLITYQRRRLRTKLCVPPAAAPRRSGSQARVARKLSAANSTARRSSSRLAAKAAMASGKFVDTATQAIQRKELLNSLFACSLSLKKQVTKHNILSRNLLPLGAAELRALVAAAKLGSTSGLDVGRGSDLVTEAAE